MAGVKGKCGGPRPNSGGARPGAGRKPKPAATEEGADTGVTRDPLEFLLDVMQGKVDANATQLRAAVAAVQYKHTKRGDGGKKDETAEKAGKVVGGRFGPAKPPLRVVNGK